MSASPARRARRRQRRTGEISPHLAARRVKALGCTCRPKVVDNGPSPIPGAICLEHERGCPLGDAVLVLERKGLSVAIGVQPAKGCDR